MNQIAYFHCDVTPPLHHPLLAGFVTPVTHIADRQWAHGVVLIVEEGPLILVTLDWCEIRNRGYALWREALAEAVGTTLERVFVHTVHQHDAVLADPNMEEVLSQYGLAGSSLDMGFFQQCIENVAAAARSALNDLRPITHVGSGEARIEEVASNRRVMKDENGKVKAMRYSLCADEEMRAAPEGLIDPFLKTIAFWNGEEQVAALHYYAVHPMSNYGKGNVSRDFCGLARDRLSEETRVPQLYFTGAAGNISAGKYNDGSAAMGVALGERMLDGMRRSLMACVRQPLESIDWQVKGLCLEMREEYPPEFYRAWLANEDENPVKRNWGALGLATYNYMQQVPDALDISCLRLNDISVLHLPGEPFVEYQLFAQQMAPDRFVALAGYGDCGPGYLPTATAFSEDGYEVGWVAFTGEGSENTIREAIGELLSV